MKYIRSIIFLIIVHFFLISCGAYPDSIPVKNWQIIYQQDESLEKIKNKDGWYPVKIPSTFILPYTPNRDFQFVWLRGEFEIAKDPSVYSGISTGRIKFSDTFYINDVLIDSRPPQKINWAPVSRNYVIPRGLLRKGINTVYIRLGMYDKYHAGILGDVLVQPEKEFDRALFNATLIYRQIPIGIVILFASFFVILLISFLLDRKDKIAFYSLWLLLASMIYIFLPITSYRIISYEFYFAMQFSLVPLFSILFMILFQTFYRVYLTYYNWIIIPLLSLIIVLIYLTRNESYNMVFSLTLVLASLIIIIPFSIFMLYKLNSINPDRFTLFITSLIGFVAISIMIFEIYSGYTGGLYSELSEIFVPPVFIILGAILTSREIVKRKRELENVYLKLKKLEGREISITESIEQKLERLVEFMKENYASDVSREGMASVIGIHPNYLGRLFKIYTGKKINDYINEIRINEAIKLLEQGDKKIIDIAFSVGFESLATFNRVFKNVMGKTPSDYR